MNKEPCIAPATTRAEEAERDERARLIAGGRRMSDTSRRQPDWLGRITGLLVFVAGIALLAAVFMWSNEQLGRIAPPVGGEFDIARDGARLGIDFLIAVAKLFLMGFVASWIAGRGAQMYAAANSAASGN